MSTHCKTLINHINRLITITVTIYQKGLVCVLYDHNQDVYYFNITIGVLDLTDKVSQEVNM